MVRHIVIFKYRPATDDERVREVTGAFRGLLDRIPGILSFECGVNSSTEGRDRGFTHVYLLTFADEHARDQYLPHPEHRRFVELLERLAIVEDVLVFDYRPDC